MLSKQSLRSECSPRLTTWESSRHLTPLVSRHGQKPMWHVSCSMDSQRMHEDTPMADDNQLPSIDLDQLAAVTGGAGSQEAMLMLPLLLAQSGNSGGDSFMQMLPMV